MQIKSWPTAAVLMVAIVAIAVTMLVGHSLGITAEEWRWLLGAEGLGSAALLAAMRGLFHDDGPSDSDFGGSGPGGALVLLVAIGIAGSLAATASGCSGAQSAISGQAEVHVATQAVRFSFYGEMDERCGAQHSERDAYRECMMPARAIAAAADEYRDLLERAQRLLDAGDEDRFSAVLVEVIGAARALAALLVEAGVEVPAEVRDLIALGGE